MTLDINKRDTQAVMKLVNEGLKIDGFELTKITICLGGKGKNRANKSRLILATMLSPICKRSILAAANTLTSMMLSLIIWSYTYVP